jgi:hypothetical protein
MHSRQPLKGSREVVPLAKGEKRGSLKSLERVLATVIAPEDAHRLTAPLFGVYDLRLGDAHMRSSQINEAFELVGVDQSLSSIRQRRAPHQQHRRHPFHDRPDPLQGAFGELKPRRASARRSSCAPARWARASRLSCRPHRLGSPID